MANATSVGADGATGPMPQTAARIMAVIRVCEGAWLVPVATAMAVTPVSLRWLVPALSGFVGWTIVFARVALTRGLVPWLVAVDVAVTVLLCLGNGLLVPVERVNDGSGWVATVASLCVVGLPLAWRAWWSVPAGSSVVVAFLAGFWLAGHRGLGVPHAGIIAGQLIASAIVMALVRRTSRTADLALAAAHRTRRDAAVEAARRADEGAQLRLLHDTALTTLTLVGTGAVADWSNRLAVRATADLATLERLGVRRTNGEDGTVRLDQVLMQAASTRTDGLRVALTAPACRVSGRVGDAFAGAVDEALRNVARHSSTSEAAVLLSVASGRVVVEVSDHGRGFDPNATPEHRLGVRESIVGRMASVGGYATVESAVGLGTRWVLEWTDGSA